MCGIVGAISFDTQAVSENGLKIMTSAIAHRGPDEDAYYIDEYLSLGFRRLSIIDVENGHQPIANEDNDMVIVVNGEIYNYKTLREQYLSKHIFRTNSDSEVVLHLYEEFGVKAFEKLNGMFAIVIWDKRNQRLVIARDRLGIKPLYLAQLEDKLLFGSELKALLHHEDCPDKVRWTDLEQPSLQQKEVISTYVEGVNFLGAGNYATFDRQNGFQEYSYWRIDDYFQQQLNQKSCAEIQQDYCQLIKDSVSKRLMSEVPVGVFLSGGVDSSIITAIAANENSNLHCFTVVERTTFRAGDVGQAKLLTEQLGVPFYPVLFDPESIAESFSLHDFEQMIYMIESPRFDPEWLFKSELHRAAKHYVPELKVILLGQGADEFAGGYSSYLGANYQSWQDYLNKAVVPDLEHYKKYNKGIPSRLSSLLKSNQTDNFSTYQRKMKLLTHQLQFFNLWHEDRTSSIHSVESRVPFLDHRIVELLAAIPESMQAELFWNKKIVRGCIPEVLNDYPDDKLKVPFFATDDISSINEFAWKIARKVYPQFSSAYFENKANEVVNTFECGKLYDSVKSRRHDMYASSWKLLELMSIAIFERLLKSPQAFEKHTNFDKDVLPLVSEPQWQMLADLYAQPAHNNNVYICDSESIVSIPKSCEIVTPLSEKEGATCLVLNSAGTEVRRMEIPDSHYWVVQLLDGIGQLDKNVENLEFWRSKVNVPPEGFYPVINNILVNGYLELH